MRDEWEEAADAATEEYFSVGRQQAHADTLQELGEERIAHEDTRRELGTALTAVQALQEELAALRAGPRQGTSVPGMDLPKVEASSCTSTFNVAPAHVANYIRRMHEHYGNGKLTEEHFAWTIDERGGLRIQIFTPRAGNHKHAS